MPNISPISVNPLPLKLGSEQQSAGKFKDWLVDLYILYPSVLLHPEGSHVTETLFPIGLAETPVICGGMMVICVATLSANCGVPLSSTENNI